MEGEIRARLAAARSVLILANGAWDDPEWSRRLVGEVDLVMAADGAANACREHGITPHLIVGDLDSASPETLTHFEGKSIIHREPDQNAFDLEKCLNLVVAHATKVTPVRIAGAFGKRLDHTLANLMLLSRFPERDFSMEDPGQRVFFVSPDEASPKNAFRAPVGTPVSLLPFGTAVGVEARGLKYRVHGMRMEPNGLLGSSNEMAQAEARVTLRSGLLAVVIQRPPAKG